MVETTLKSIFPDIEVSTLKRNATYNFEVKVTTLKKYGTTLLFTEGLSNEEQSVTAGFESFKRIELYFCLPDYWDLKAQDWPIEWINRLAEVPQKNETWFGPGDTIPAGNPPEILTDRFPANHFVLSEPIHLEALFKDEKWLPGIQFLGIIPICQLELDYKLKNSATVLIYRIKKKGYSEKVDVFRTSVCRKRFLGI